MKITKILALLLVSVITFSCSSDDDGNTNSTPEGTWKMTAFLAETAFDLNGDGSASNDIIIETGCYQNETFVLNADNTGINISTSFADIYLELVVGTTDEYEYIIDCLEYNDTFSFNWSLDGSTISLNEEGESSYAVGTLSGNTITFVIPDGYYNEVEENGTIVEVNEDLTIIYTKQ